MNSNTSKKLIIFDGTSILNDFYYKTLTKEFQEWKKGNLSEEEAYQSLLKCTNGNYINAIQGFLKIFFELIDIQNPSHLIVVWGSFKEKNFRHSIYSDYKGSSTQLDYPLKEQFSTIKNILSKIGVIQYSSHKYESQDLAGSVANFFRKEIPTYIFTRNSNLLQLVEFAGIWIKTKNSLELSKKLSLDLTYYPKDYILYNKELVSKIIGLEYNQIIDYKAVIGNKNSGIPGAKGIGKESIFPLLKLYGSIESIYNKIESLNESELNKFWDEIRKKVLIKKNPINHLLKYKDDIMTSKKLLTIKTDIISSLPKDKNPLTLSTLEFNIDTTKVLTELKKIDLAPIVEQLNNNNPQILSSLIQTYNPYILSPSAKEFIGENITDISEKNISNINSIIYLPKVSNIIKLRKNIKSHIKSNSDKKLDNKDLSDNSKSVALSEFPKYISTDDIILDNECSKTEGDNLNSILKTLPENSLLKTLLNEDIIKSSDKIGISNNNTFKLVKSFSINIYQCSHCNKEFIVTNSQPNFCTNCGFGKINISDINTNTI